MTSVYKTVPTHSHRSLSSQAQRTRAAAASTSAFLAAVGLCVGAGLAGLSTDGAMSLPEWGEGFCLRVKRQSSLSTALVAIGTPLRIYKLAIRLDHVVTAPATYIFSEEVLQSSTLNCDSNRTCRDAALLTTADGLQSIFDVEFSYGSAERFALERSVGVDGVFGLSQWHDYALTKTHLCWRDHKNATTTWPPPGFDAVVADVVGDQLTVAAGALADAGGLFGATPAASCNESVELFPMEAVHEQTWLALSTDFLFQSHSAHLDDRRLIVERGTECAYESAHSSMYALDCSLDGRSVCQTHPSVPFRRVASADLRLQTRDTTVSVGARHRVALSRIAGACSTSSSIFFTSTRFAVLLIVSFVVYSRSGRRTNSAIDIIEHAIDVSRGRPHRSTSPLIDVVADAAVGVFAVASRLLVLLFQFEVFVDDGHSGVVAFEFAGIAASATHFLLRHAVLTTDLTTEPPIRKLGGSMALADASVTSLISVVSTPTLTAHEFDAVARLFCVCLIALYVVCRVCMSASACALLAETTATDLRYDHRYTTILRVSTALWLVQAASVGYAIARLFVLPQAFSHTRFSPTQPHDATAVAVLFGVFCFAAPELNRISVRLARSVRRSSGD